MHKVNDLVDILCIKINKNKLQKHDYKLRTINPSLTMIYPMQYHLIFSVTLNVQTNIANTLTENYGAGVRGSAQRSLALTAITT